METVLDLVDRSVERWRNAMAFQAKEGWSWKQSTWLDFAREVRQAACLLRSRGFGRGSRGVFAGPVNVETLVLAVASQAAGGVPVFVPDAGEDALGPSPGAAFAAGPGCEGGGTVVRFGGDAYAGGGELAYKAVLKLGAMARRGVEEALEGERASLAANTPALGFARRPAPRSGLEVREVTHAAVLEALGRAAARLAPLAGGDCQVFGYFPQAVPFAVVAPFVCMSLGLRQSFASEPGEFWFDVREVKPRGILTTAGALVDLLRSPDVGGAGGLAPKALRRALGGRAEWVAVDVSPEPAALGVLERAGLGVVELAALAL